MRAYSKQTFDEFYVDIDTRNTSFVKMALVLHEYGVSNYYFFLKLYNKNLVGVDPYSKEVSKNYELQAQILKECATNRWYFFREVFRVQETGASTDVGGGTRFELNRGNLAYLWATELNLSTYLILPRQVGKTWVAIADIVYDHHFNKNTNVLHFNKDQSNANDNLRRIQIAINMLPLYLQHSNIELLRAQDKRRVKNNEKTIRNSLNSTILAMSSAGNEAKADAMARGKTAEKIWYDEFAFIFFNGIIYSAAYPAHQKAAEVAKKNKVPYSITITTTPGDLASPHGKYAYEFMEKCLKFTEDLFDYEYDELMDLVNRRKTSKTVPFIFIQFMYWQLGKTEKWYIEVSSSINDPIKSRREFLLEWINTNAESPFDPDDIEMIARYSMDMEKSNPKVIKLNKYYTMTIYGEYKGRKPIPIGIDVATGKNQDSTAIVAIHPDTLVPIAVFRSNQISSKELRKLIATIVRKIYPNSIITIENNSIGQPLISELMGTDIERVLYREKKNKKVDRGVNNFTRKRNSVEYEFGHNTNGSTRVQMMEMLEDIVHISPQHLGIPEIYNEVRHMVRRSGRICHSSATHDDCTMAYLGILWVIRYGKGLRGTGIYYNIGGSEDDDGFREAFDEEYDKRIASIIMNRGQRNPDDDVYERFTTEHKVETSTSLWEKEHDRYIKELDRQHGVLDYWTEEEMNSDEGDSYDFLDDSDNTEYGYGYSESGIFSNYLDF